MRVFCPALAALVFLAACEARTPSAPPATTQEAHAAVPAVPLGASPQRGQREAKVTIVVFSEAQCPFCGRAKRTLDEVRAAYPEDVRLVFKHLPLPFHARAVPAALALEAARAQGHFWEMHDRLFAHQRALSDADLAKHAEAVGLDLERFRADLADPALRKRVSADQALAKRLGVRGTPTFFINGRRLVGAQPFPRFRSVIDAEIRRADAALGAGVRRSELYATLVREGLTRPVAERKGDARPGNCQGGPAGAAARAAAAPAAAAPAQRVEIDPGDSPARGPADAPVTMVLFSDLECPFCKRIEPTLAALEKAFPGKIRVVWKNAPLPMHRNARSAAAALLAAGGQGRFWAFHDRIVKSAKRPTAEALQTWATEVGLNAEQLRNEMSSRRVQGIIDADLRLGAKLGVRGTPTTFINGRRVAGAVPLATFRKIVEEELQRLK